MRRDVFNCDCMNPDGFTVTIDCSKSRDELIVAGDYRHDPRHLPEFEDMFLLVKNEHRANVRLGFLHVYQPTDIDSVLAAVDKRRASLAGPASLLALGAQHPELQMRHPIVELGDIHRETTFPVQMTALALTGFRDERDGYRDLETVYLENGLKAGMHVLIAFR